MSDQYATEIDDLRLENSVLKSRVDTLEKTVHRLVENQQELAKALGSSVQNIAFAPSNDPSDIFQTFCGTINKKICVRHCNFKSSYNEIYSNNKKQIAIDDTLQVEENIWEYKGTFRDEINKGRTSSLVTTTLHFLRDQPEIDFPQHAKFERFLTEVIESKMSKRFSEYKKYGEPGSEAHKQYQTQKRRKNRKKK
jgi:hypothetical protein